jgi:hypothetical protein
MTFSEQLAESTHCASGRSTQLFCLIAARNVFYASLFVSGFRFASFTGNECAACLCTMVIASHRVSLRGNVPFVQSFTRQPARLAGSKRFTQVARAEAAYEPKGQNLEAVRDIDAIMKALPHRYSCFDWMYDLYLMHFITQCFRGDV